MFRNTHRIALLVAAIAVFAVALPASAGAVDLRNPDSRSAALDAQRNGSVDLRSPDARDAGRPAQTPSPASGAAASSATAGSSFDWGDAGIGAGSTLGLLLILLSVTFGVVHRRRSKVRGPGDRPLTA